MGASLAAASGASGGPSSAALEQHQYLTFMLAGDTYAIGILHVKEIIGYGQVTPVPMSAACIRGVINLRGRVVPVIDLAARFGKEAPAVGKRTCIVILETEVDGEVQDMGVVVDAVNEVVEIPRQQMESPPAFGAQIRTDFIEGMGRVEAGFVVILKVEQVLAMDELTAIQERGWDALAQPAGPVPVAMKSPAAAL